MNEKQALAFLRRLVGDPTSGAESDRQFIPWLEDALDFLGRELQYSLKEDEYSLELEEDEQEYPLLADVQTIQWLRYADRTLRSATTQQWLRDGLDYKGAQSGIPMEYCFEGRKIIFDCPVSGDAIAAYPRATFKYVSSSPGLTPSNMPALPDADARLACRYAALQYCYANPTPENTARANALAAVITMALEEARRRHGHPIEDLQPSVGVKTSRRGAAR